MGERILGFPHSTEGFGLLRGAMIMPHYDEFPSAMIHTLRMLVRDEQTFLGIEGNTALVGENGDWQVVGSGGVVVWSKREKKRYTQGEWVRW